MSDLVLPTTRYAVSGEVNIAYQTMGDGPIDIVLVPGIISHVEFLHEFSEYTAFLRRLSKFARVVTFDKRGQGLSDRISGAPALEERMDDLRAIMDAIGSQRAALLGVSEGSAMSALFAATYPERVSQLILYGGFARNADLWEADSSAKRVLPRLKHWGNGGLMKAVNPSRAEDQEAVNQFAKTTLGQPWSLQSNRAVEHADRCQSDPADRARSDTCASPSKRCSGSSRAGTGFGGANSRCQIYRIPRQ
jgi:pimeloyl-ACP methyl ester carboxylesterase